jgi:Domain of unknown function (DUF4351)
MMTPEVKGMLKAMETIRRRDILLLLQKKFGPLSPAVGHRVIDWPAERLEELLLALLDASSLRALGLEE